jgi:negative regulator of flagellin synthesis FlgM
VTIIHHGLDVNPSGLGSAATDKTQPAQGQGASLQTLTQAGLDNSQPEVQITPAAQLLANVEQQLANTPEVDQGRVDAIRQALSNGTYQIDSSRVADGLLAAQNFDAQASSGGGGAQAQSLKAFATTAQLGSDSQPKE